VCYDLAELAVGGGDAVTGGASRVVPCLENALRKCKSASSGADRWQTGLYLKPKVFALLRRKRDCLAPAVGERRKLK
jgi:hypothetical protein